MPSLRHLKIILIGNAEECAKAAPGVDLSGIELVDPTTSPDTDKYAELLFKTREGKINKKTGQAEYPTVQDAKNYILKDLFRQGGKDAPREC